LRKLSRELREELRRVKREIKELWRDKGKR